MSRTFSIGCRQCRKHVWIAQASAASGNESTTLYRGEAHDKALNDFLFDHMGHQLVFDSNETGLMEDWEEIFVPEVPTVIPPEAIAEIERTNGIVDVSSIIKSEAPEVDASKTTIELIKQYGLLVRPSALTHGWIASKFKGITGSDPTQPLVHSETSEEAPTIEEAVNRCCAALKNFTSPNG